MLYIRPTISWFLNLNDLVGEDSKVILGTFVTIFCKGRFESWFGYLRTFKKNWAPMPLPKVWANSRRPQNSKWPPAAILEFTNLHNFWIQQPIGIIEVSFYTNIRTRNLFLGLFFHFEVPFNEKSKMAAIHHMKYILIFRSSDLINLKT